MSTPPDNRENEAERQNDGIRDEIEEILRESGEKPVLPRPPRAQGGGPINNLAGMVRNMGGGSGGVRPMSGTFMRTAMLLLLLRVALGLAFAFIAVRILGPRAILLLIVIALAVLALITVRYMIARRRYGQ